MTARGVASASAERSQAEDLVRILLALAKVEDDPEAQAQAFVRAGDVYRDSLGLYRSLFLFSSNGRGFLDCCSDLYSKLNRGQAKRNPAGLGRRLVIQYELEP